MLFDAYENLYFSRIINRFDVQLMELVYGPTWYPVLEKAWAKVGGNYLNTFDQQHLGGSLRALTGAPVFRGYASDIVDDISQATFFETMTEAAQNEWPIVAHTDTDANSLYNSCGLKNGYSYSIITSFTMETRKRRTVTIHNMLLIRSPDDTNEYAREWSRDDRNWDDDLIATIPYGFDPNSRWVNGFFVAPDTVFRSDMGDNCFTSYEIAHMREDEGY